ncbi:hypothetical protein HWV62_2542 [Athelia sp. TMB]|nr:hypothetical protein HWV62_2542 [Athelia sp. TMB]
MVEMRTQAMRAPPLSQLAGLDATLRSLEIEYSTIVNQTAPIASLPNEVLAMIFEESHASQQTRYGSYVYHSEMRVSHVTTHWRQVAIRTPKLWTRIRRISNPPTSLDAIDTYLQRSKRMPIELHATVGYDDDEADSDDDTEPYYQLIAPHMARCCHLFIDSCSRKELIRHLDLLSAKRAPFLQTIKLSCSYSFDSPGRRVQPDMLSGGAPLLTTLCAEGILWQELLPSQILGSVTTIICDEMESDVLFHTPKLLHLWLENLVLEEEIMATSENLIILPYLTTLSINIEDMDAPGHISSFLTALNAPALETLILRNVASLDWGNKPLRRGKFPALRHLAILSSELNTSEVLGIATGCRYITHLTYEAGKAKLEDLRVILGRSEVVSGANFPLYWPDLQALHLSGRPDAMSTLKMLLARRHAGGTLNKLLVEKAAFLTVMGHCQSLVEVEEYTPTLKRILVPSY